MAIAKGTTSLLFSAGRFPRSVISGSFIADAPASTGGGVKNFVRVVATPSLIAWAYSPGRGPKPKR